MNLYMTPVAPNPTRVWLYVAEKNAGGAGIDLNEIRINLLNGEQNGADHLARNVFARVPVLERTLADARPFVAGEACTIVDCTLQAAFQFARFAALDAYSMFANLRRWDEDYRARSSVSGVLTH